MTASVHTNTWQPLVSIVIPVYNGANYMREAIDSALAQTYPNIEVIVVNDGSTDETEQIALSYGDRIRYFSKENGGQSSALNCGISKMYGEYFSWLSHDDLYVRDKIEVQVDVMRSIEFKDAILFSGYETIDRDGNSLSVVDASDAAEMHPSLYLLLHSVFNGNTLLIPKSAFDECGMFNLKRPHTSDVELFYSFSRVYPFVYVPGCLVKSRSHQEQATWRNYRYHVYEINQFLIDTVNRMSDDELAMLDKNYTAGELLRELVLTYSSRGFSHAYRFVLYRMRATGHELSLQLELLAHAKYFNKRFKRFLGGMKRRIASNL